MDWHRCSCRGDADCREHLGGVCVWGCGAHPSTCSAQCRYDACQVDTDCKTGSICVPAGPSGPVSRCIPAHCRSNADCPQGACRLFTGVIACVTPPDLCTRCPQGEKCTVDERTGQARCSPDPGPPP